MSDLPDFYDPQIDDGFGRPIHANKQIPVEAVKFKPHHARWLVAVWRDDSFDVGEIGRDAGGTLHLGDSAFGVPYDELWKTLARMTLTRGVWWLVGWGARKAIEYADLLGALERGEVKLPTPRKSKGKRTRSGSLTVSPGYVNVDLVCGKNRIKLLDLDQLGLSLPLMGLDLGGVDIDRVTYVLSDYLRLCDAHGISASRTSAAQTGWATYRSRFLPGSLCVNLDFERRELERASYFNGRVEAYRLGDVPGITYSLDVKSCYAHVCRQCEVPVQLMESYPVGLHVDRVKPDGGDHWIASCVVRTDSADYPLRWQGQPIYPIGEFHTTLAWPELRHALLKGRVVQITQAQRYRSSAALARYAQWYLDARAALKASDLLYLDCVLKSQFVASLGYTARREYSWQPWDVQHMPDWWIGITHCPEHAASAVAAHVLDGRAEWLRIGGEPRDALPFLHSTITSWARIHLLSICDAVGRENVLYVDTDGLLVTESGFFRALGTPDLCGDNPGQLAERFPSGKCRIQGQKSYRLGNNIICAGLVQHRRSEWLQKTVLTTHTGRADRAGVVTPFSFHCYDCGDMRARWRNEMDGAI